MKYHIPDRVMRDIITFSKEYNIQKVVLFGSRVRGTHTDRSDIDIAVLKTADFQMLRLIRDSFIPAFVVLEKTLKEKFAEANEEDRV